MFATFNASCCTQPWSNHPVFSYLYYFYAVRFKESLDATKPQGAILDLMDVVKKQHFKAKANKQPCSGIIYVHKREDCHALATQISKVRFYKQKIPYALLYLMLITKFYSLRQLG